ncbi:MAG: biotin transporter BioY [Peptococcaceae bacterium]|nr:biotin transporter BioY [Peptococcaceae bacterium]
MRSGFYGLKPSPRLAALGAVVFFAGLNALGARFCFQQANGDYLTLQSAAVLASAMLLDYRRAAAAQAVYLLLGLAGLPVFAAGGGWKYVFQPSFGYLAAFFPAACLCAYCLEKTPLKSLKSYLGFGLGALGIIYGMGVGYRYFMLNVYLRRSMAMAEVLRGLLPLQIPKDILICLFLSWLLAKRDQLRRKKAWREEEPPEEENHLKDERNSEY